MSRSRGIATAVAGLLLALVASAWAVAQTPGTNDMPRARANAPLSEARRVAVRTPPERSPDAPREPSRAEPPASEASPGKVVPSLWKLAESPELRQSLGRTVPTMALFAVASLVPAAILMVTAFVRIHIVLSLLRQALGSPQIPGNQVLAALSLLLTAVVMMPTFERVYREGIAPYAEERASLGEAWQAGTAPVRTFMIEQIARTGHEAYLWRLYDLAVPPSPGRVEPTEYEQFPLHILAPAFLLSELTTALALGFAIYLPFLVIDLVVSAVLAAMGLFMLPPTLVALPLKLILFVLADGWMLVSDMLIRSFHT